MLYIGADHRGYKLKEEIKKYLDELGVKYEDVGAFSLDAQDDYPDFAGEAARRISEAPKEHRGILLCGSGVGVDITANKFKGVRSGLVFTEKNARQSRADDNTNVLSLPADDLSPDEAKRIVFVWLGTPFSNEERHRRRIRKIGDIERNN